MKTDQLVDEPMKRNPIHDIQIINIGIQFRTCTTKEILDFISLYFTAFANNRFQS